MKFLKSETLGQIPSLIHGFGTLEENIPEPFLANWDLQRPRWKQVHGTAACRVESGAQECADVDALYSYQPGIPIAVQSADCVPILMARKDGGAIAAIHAGWRGTRSRIVKRIWKELADHGESTKDWVASVGPAIGPCCYEVSAELISEFKSEFMEMEEDVINPAPRMLDLQMINGLELESLGLSQVELLRFCTRCFQENGKPGFHSFRREGSGFRQFSILMRQGA
jgi:polyphenol oxidase